MSASTVDVDPITLQVIQSNLVSIVDEMETNMTRTAYSPIVYEVKDLCAALLDTECRIVAQARGGLPIFLADLGAPVSAGVEKFGLDGFAPGDVVVINAPYATGQHLNNVVAFTPIFRGPKLVGFAAVRAHWSDIGGAVPGSFSTNSSDTYAEGLVLDGVKIVAGGVEDPQIRRLLESNIRYPAETFGDLRAQIAACRIGERRFVDLLERYGEDTLTGAVDQIWTRSELAARAKLRATANGTFSASSFLDNDGISDEPVHIRCTVTLDDDTMTVDLSECSPEVEGNVNCGESAAIAAVRVAFKSFTSPDTPADEGSFRPLKVVVPPGRFLSAQPPAAMGQWSACVPLLIDTILLALSGADRDRVPAAHHGSLGPYIWTGSTAAGREFVHVDTCVGGWGGSPGRDGGVGLKTYMHGDTHTVPSEIEEAMFPLRVEFNRLEPDTGGAGEFRGGLATAKCYRALRDVNLTFAFEREKCRPWGREGGLEGTYNRLVPLDADGVASGPAVSHGTLRRVEKDTMVVLISGSGGGCGQPERRDPARIEADLRHGYITPEAARTVYGHTPAETEGAR